jgi:hypothetical protein
MPPDVVLNGCLPAESRARSFHLALAAGSFVEPIARDASAIQVFRDLGLRMFGHVQSFVSGNRNDSYLLPGPSLHGRAFDC